MYFATIVLFNNTVTVSVCLQKIIPIALLCKIKNTEQILKFKCFKQSKQQNCCRNLRKSFRNLVLQKRFVTPLNFQKHTLVM